MKKTLKQQYLDAPTRAGVYAIRNRITNRALVAGHLNAQGALNRHRFELQHGQHRNPDMTHDWAMHGGESFVFEVLDLVTPRDTPGFDLAEELALLTALWRQDLSCQGNVAYDHASSSRPPAPAATPEGAGSSRQTQTENSAG